jgi:nucleoside-diphosphate-sugar epimerase
MMSDKILVIGACGQIGTELTEALRQQHGPENVIAADVRPHQPGNGHYIQLDVLDHAKLEKVIRECGVTQVYLLVAMLSATGEKDPTTAWKLNMQSLLSVLEIARIHQLDKVFWPSSIAVFGPTSPKHQCPQDIGTEPNTVYGMSKRAGENWCHYYFEKYGVDVRSLRFPGLVSYSTPPGGGTTDYAVDIFHQALAQGNYECFLNEDTCLPMLYMPDAIRATLKLMNAPKENIGTRTSYNLAGMSFAPCDLAAELQQHLPGFTISYRPDFRQAIAAGWPASIDSQQAAADWGWQPVFDLKKMTKDMLQQLGGKRTVLEGRV